MTALRAAFYCESDLVHWSFQTCRNIRQTFAFERNAALTNLMASAANGPATINGNSRQNLGNLELVF
jgi:hypothetical protein